MRKNILRVILMTLLLGTFFIIFGFSSQDAEKSGNLSSSVTKLILGQEEREDIVERAESVIRKIAHFCIYTLVGFLLMALVSTYDLEENKRIRISLGIGILYATSDEIHQLFIPGRSGQITDIILDSMGVIIGILFLLIIVEIDKRKRKNNAR